MLCEVRSYIFTNRRACELLDFDLKRVVQGHRIDDHYAFSRYSDEFIDDSLMAQFNLMFS